jgi:hypothetical protein
VPVGKYQERGKINTNARFDKNERERKDFKKNANANLGDIKNAFCFSKSDNLTVKKWTPKSPENPISTKDNHRYTFYTVINNNLI